MIQPIDLSTFPYVTGIRIRIIQPDFEHKSWTVVADHADPKALYGHGGWAGRVPLAPSRELSATW